jgi:hypothetical protein
MIMVTIKSPADALKGKIPNAAHAQVTPPPRTTPPKKLIPRPLSGKKERNGPHRIQKLIP